MPPDNQNSEAAAVIAISREAERNLKPEIIELFGTKATLASNGAVCLLESKAENPRRKRATVGIYETASFIDYVNRHKTAGATHLFGKATELGGSFTAVLDYHEAEKTDGKPLPGWGQHTAKLTLEVTPEWARWVGNNTKLIGQEAFAEFIEDNMNDIVTPDAASVLEIAQGLQGRKNVQFKSGKNLRDGSIQLEYIETIEVQGAANRRDDAFKMPEKIQLGIVPFVGAEGVYIEARLRFRIGSDGKLSFAYILNRPYKVIEAAFLLARGKIEQETGIKVILGNGEVSSPSSIGG
jgi:uncharacterized protein YfdQ (DUF2303 family)